MVNVPIPSHLVVDIKEDASGRVTLVLKNGFKFKAHKNQFKNYEQYRKKVYSGRP